MNYDKSLMSYFNILITLFILNACSTNSLDERKIAEETEQQKLAKDVKEEISIGREMAAKLYGSFGEYEPKKALIYVNLVGKSLARQIGRPEVTYKFGILDSDEVNAFATPGGYILLTKGLLKNLKSESELAAVIAHEIAHVNAKHMYKEIAPKRDVSQGENVTRLLSRGGDNIGAAFGKAVSEGMKKLLDQGLSPEKEYEADALAVMYSSACGYNPKGLVTVLERLKEQQGLHVGKTHPSFEARIQKIEKEMKINGIEATVRGDQEVLLKRFLENLTVI